MDLPFDKIESGSDWQIREFKSDVTLEDLKWHRDLEDRWVKSTHNSDWMIQLENSLPISIQEETFIPAKSWHRLIRGTGDLKVLVKINNIDEDSRS
jgi:hypothetical protein